MKRRHFIKGSAIIGATLAVPSLLFSSSGMYASTTNRQVHRILNAGKTNVGSLPIMRAFAGDHNDFVSPYVLFDEFGPVSIAPGADSLRVGAHPHAGVTPTTFFLSGSGHHKDSLNYDFQVNTGELMHFSSGRGAIHMEESGQELKEKGGTIHGFQIWLNTPKAHKFAAPTTSVFNDSFMPTIVKEQYTVKVVMGELFGVKSNVKTLSPTFYYHLRLKPGCRLDIPTDPGHNAFIYAVNGAVEIEGQKQLKKHQIVLYKRGASNINLYTKDGAELFLLGGQPLDEVVYSYGPFVMNNRQQIEQCYRDYQSGKMGDPNQVNQ